jgi:hypothetical protein
MLRVMMRCPFLEEIVVNYCAVAPIRKMIPKGSSDELSKCERCYLDCPVYQNWLKKKKEESRNGKSRSDG